MRFWYNLIATFLLGLFVTAVSPWDAPAQDIKSGVVNSRDRILNPTTNQQQQVQQQNSNGADPREKGADVAVKGKPGPLPCNSKNNPKCEPFSPSKPGDTPGKGKGN